MSNSPPSLKNMWSSSVTPSFESVTHDPIPRPLTEEGESGGYGERVVCCFEGETGGVKRSMSKSISSIDVIVSGRPLMLGINFQNWDEDM